MNTKPPWPISPPKKTKGGLKTARLFLNSPKFSAGQPAAVHVYDGAVHVIRLLGSEEQDRLRDIFRFAPARFGNAGENGFITFLVFANRTGVFGGDVTRRDGVGVDAFLRQFVGERLGDAGNAAFAGRVTGHNDAALKRKHRSDVHNLEPRIGVRFIATAGEPPFAHGLREEKRRGQVDLDDGVPIGLRMVNNRRAFDDAGAIDEHVHTTSLLHNFGDEVAGALLRELAEVLGVSGAFRTEFFGLGGGFRLVTDVHADDMSAFARERQRDGLADSAAGTGDDGRSEEHTSELQSRQYLVCR